MSNDTAAWLRTIPSLTGIAPPLDTTHLPSEPIELFYSWLDRALAQQVPEPLATTLSTVDDDGVPDARVLLLKNVDVQGWAFAGLRSSRKGHQLGAHPCAALSLWWQPQARAIRVRGRVEEAGSEQSRADLAARSASARAGVAPEDWTLWRLVPERVEFWQGSPDRRHHRIIYSASTEGSWSLEVRTG